MTLLLMAAGSGSRYGKLKQFDDLGPNGEFLMEFAMYDAIENDFEQIVVITKAENVAFLKEHLSERLPKRYAWMSWPKRSPIYPMGRHSQESAKNLGEPHMPSGPPEMSSMVLLPF